MSIDLANILSTYKTDIVGTMRQNKLGVPPEIKTAQLNRGQFVARYNNKIMLLKWGDKRNVLFLSTYYGAGMVKKEKHSSTYSAF